MRIGISAMWLSSEANSRNSGLSRYAFHLIEHLSLIAPGHEFVVFVPDSFEIPAGWRLRHGIDVLQVAVPSLRQRVAWEHFAPRRLAYRHQLDVWFSAAQVIPLRCPIPTAVMVHDVIPLLFPAHHLKRTVIYYRWALRYVARHADLILTNSACTKRDVVRMFGVDPEKVTDIPLGPGVVARDDDAAYRSLGVREPFLFALGSLEWRKNLHGLVDAFASLPEDLTLVIGGGKRMTAKDFVGAKIQSLGLESRVQMLGFVPEGALPELFRRSAAFVFPSLYEGFGLPVLEAITYGAVVACSDRGATPEIAGDLAFSFDPSSKSSMAAATRSAITTPDRAERIEMGKRRAAEFSWERTARETIAALERLQ